MEAAADADRLIRDTARILRHRYRLDLLLPAAPPACAVLAALMLGRLPVEILAASAIALGTLFVHLASVEVASPEAARFLDRSLAAKEHFLTLATVPAQAPFRSVVKQRASAIAGRSAPTPPARSSRALAVSTVLSALFLLVLWMIPRTPIVASTGEPLERIAAALAASPGAGDRALAAQLREVVRVLHDPRSSNQEKRAAVDKAMAAAERRGTGSSGTGSSPEKNASGGSGRPGERGQQQGAGPGPGGSADDARGQAQQRLSELAGELSTETAAKSADGRSQKQQPSGGGIKGPEDGADQRKPSDRDASGNQPGKSPQQQGGAQASSAESGQGGSPSPNQPQPNPQQQAGDSRVPQLPGEGIGQRTAKGPDKQSERYYKPGEGPDAAIDGQYVRMRVPEDGRPVPGSEEVAKPGEVSAQVGYGNAPLPPPGPAGEVSAEQPVPLEYRRALGMGPAAR